MLKRPIETQKENHVRQLL